MRKKKTSQKTRLSKRDRDRIVGEIRETFRNITQARMNRKDETLKEAHLNFNRRCSYLGADWKLEDECDNRHPVPFWLRTDVDLRKVKTAVGNLFPDEADDLRKNIIESVKRFKKERGKQERWIESLFSIRELVNALSPWLKEIPVHTSEQVLAQLFKEEYDLRIKPGRFKKQLPKIRQSIKGKN